jgi:DNA-binding transcriptional ArsR family regulator
MIRHPLTGRRTATKVHQPVNYRARANSVSKDLDTILAALANGHRREMVTSVAIQPRSISALARERGLSLPAMNKHVRVLEEAGLVGRRKTGRTTFLTLDRTAIRDLQAWVMRFHAYWGTEQETLENYGPSLAREPDPGKE